MTNQSRVMNLLAEAKRISREYHEATGKPLGITGEVAEYEAARLLGLELTAARQAGYDATERVKGSVRRIQIKGRCLQDPKKPGHRLGGIRTNHEWDSVILVLLDPRFETVAIYEADRPDVIAALSAPGSVFRNERGALSISKFKSIGRRRWPEAV